MHSNFNRTLLSCVLAHALTLPTPAGGTPPMLATIDSVLTLRPSNAAQTEYELLIYGDIGDSWSGESVTAKKVVDQLAALPATVTDIHVRINTYGGSVSDGLAIINALNRHPARKLGTVDGVAMSVGSLIACNCKPLQMAPASVMMIHAPWGYASGNANDMRRMAEVLDTFAEAMVGVYVAKTGKPKAEMLALITDGKDHYYTGEQAVAAGFADESITTTTTTTSNSTAEERRVRAAGLSRFLPGMPEEFAELVVAAAARKPAAAFVPAPTIPATTAEPEEEAMRRSRILNMILHEPTTEGGPGAAAAPTAAALAAANAAALAAIGVRNTEINAAAQPFLQVDGVSAIHQRALSDPTVSVDAFRTQMLTHLGARNAPAAASGPHIVPGPDARDQRVEGISNALVARAGLMKPIAGNEFRNIRMHTMIRMSLAAAGVAGVDRMEGPQLSSRILALHSTSDFPLILAATANKVLRAAYEMAEATWQKWCAQGDVPDFKTNSRVQLGSFNSLSTKRQGQPYESGSMTEESENIQAATKGRTIALTREMIINDDLGAFLRVAKFLGAAAKRTVNEDVYAFLAANAATNDGGAFFNSTAGAMSGVGVFNGGHANLASSSTAITVAAIAAMEAAMALQKDPGLKATLNISPKYLLAPRGKKQIAYEVLTSPADPASSNSGKKNYAASLGLEVVSDAELDKASTTAWYLTADPNQCAPVEVVFLNGDDIPHVEENVDFHTDAMELKVRLDYGVGPGDWRGAQKNAGA